MVGFCLLVNQHFAQAPSAAFAPIKDRLERWDDIRGAWLAAAIQALAMNRNVPDRTFPEDFTPYEMLSMIPGMGSKMKDVDIDENSFKGIEAMINSMTPAERADPDLLDLSRKKRIANGSGKDLQEVNNFLKQFAQMRDMMKNMNKLGAFGKMMPGMRR